MKQAKRGIVELGSWLGGKDVGAKPEATAAKDISRIKGDPTLKVKLSKVIVFQKRDGRT